MDSSKDTQQLASPAEQVKSNHKDFKEGVQQVYAASETTAEQLLMAIVTGKPIPVRKGRAKRILQRYLFMLEEEMRFAQYMDDGERAEGRHSDEYKIARNVYYYVVELYQRLLNRGRKQHR